MVRESKNRPTEVSSKKPVSVFREVTTNLRKKAIDPRFDRSFGSFNEDLYGKSYSFLGEIQEGETEMLKSSLSREKNDSVRKQNLKRALDRVSSLKKERERKENQRSLIKEHRSMESKLVAEGKNPYYLKSSDYKKLDLANRFSKLKEDNQYKGFMERKLKKKASKQRKFLPN